MGHRDTLGPLRWLDAGGNIMDGVNDVRAIVAVPATIADTNGDILQDDKAVLMFERLAFDRARLDGAVAVLTGISVHIM
jgi:hypothetical protein